MWGCRFDMCSACSYQFWPVLLPCRWSYRQLKHLGSFRATLDIWRCIHVASWCFHSDRSSCQYLSVGRCVGHRSLDCQQALERMTWWTQGRGIVSVRLHWTFAQGLSLHSTSGSIYWLWGLVPSCQLDYLLTLESSCNFHQFLFFSSGCTLHWRRQWLTSEASRSAGWDICSVALLNLIPCRPQQLECSVRPGKKTKPSLLCQVLVRLRLDCLLHRNLQPTFEFLGRRVARQIVRGIGCWSLCSRFDWTSRFVRFRAGWSFERRRQMFVLHVWIQVIHRSHHLVGRFACLEARSVERYLLDLPLPAHSMANGEVDLGLTPTGWFWGSTGFY